jgi:hypothetical protein
MPADVANQSFCNLIFFWLFGKVDFISIRSVPNLQPNGTISDRIFQAYGTVTLY